MGKRIVVTGGSGRVGRHVIDYLLKQGHEILNLDLMPLPDSYKDVHTIKVDLTDSGQVFNAISSHFKHTQPQRRPVIQAPDAVVHLGAYARPMIVSDNETFRGNTQGTYNVIEAACKLGVKKIVIASTVCVYGVTYAEGDVDFPSFPIDEDIDTNPIDTYAISKVCCERVARGFARRFDVDIYAMRIGAHVLPEEYDEIFRSYVHEPENWKVHGWSYTDARDFGQMCDLAVKTDGLGFQVFNAINDEITCTVPTDELLKRLCPNTPFTRDMGEREAPMSNRKIKEMLGFKEEHHWRKYYQV